MHPIIFVHPTGNANARAAANGLCHSGNLEAFHTAIGVFPRTLLDFASKFPGLGELNRRRFDPALQPFTRLHPWREAGRLFALRAGVQSLAAHETGPFCVDAVYRSLDRKVAKSLQKSARRGGVYAYEDGALALFEAAKVEGSARFYDLPIGYWRAARRLLGQELERRPDWAETLKGFKDSEAKLARKDRELALADRIFVASSFTKKTLEDYPGSLAPVEVVPYGFPPVADFKKKAFGKRPIKLLFVGGLSQRKGIADLFEAVEGIGPRVELTVVGRKASDRCLALNAALAEHRWLPSLPHARVLQLMREQDILVFPSLFEGFGLVITEAMSQGTPVITTDRTAGPDLIEHDHNGWLVEAGNMESLRYQLEELLRQPERIGSAGNEAIETARRRPWEVYGRELAEVVARFFKNPGREG